jgi:hypothetical protein
MKIKAALTREESYLLYDLIASSLGTGKLYRVICRRLPRYDAVFGDYWLGRNEPRPYSDLTKEDWVLLVQLLNLSDEKQKALLGYEPCGGLYLWRKIGGPVKEYLRSKGTPIKWTY